MKISEKIKCAAANIAETVFSPINIKLIIRSLSCGLVICGLLSITGFCAACDDIDDRILRFHILANSDSQEDQSLKLLVRDEIIAYTDSMFSSCKTKEEAVSAASEHIKDIEKKAQNVVYSEGYNYDVTAYVTKMHFDTRVYDDFTLPSGEYDAVRIVIGSGKGHNWWCVLYPAVCVPSAQKNIGSVLNKNETDIVTGGDRFIVRFKIAEVISSLFKK